MSWQAGFYFGMVILAVALTGFLAWQAWKQKNVAGSHFYFWLALTMCFAALGEALSMLSPSQALALFWFKTRFLSFAVIPPLWFLFVLEYSGRRAWRSKGLVAGLFVIPAVTQVMLWTSGWHSLWVQQEVGFRPDGPFWIADVALRVPGFWFLVHSFYSQSLTLAGSVLLMRAAWSIASLYRLQAICITASALVPVMLTGVAIFNFVPKGGINPTIPGLALAAALASVAVFRYDFLKKDAAAQLEKTRGSDAGEKRSLGMFLLAFCLLVSGVAAVGYLSFINFERNLHVQVEEQLFAIATLKIHGLEDWRNERLGDAEILRQNAAFAGLVEGLIENPGDPTSAERLRAWLDSLKESYEYRHIYLLDTEGAVRISSSNGVGAVDAHILTEISPTLQGGQAVFLDFHRHASDQEIHLSILVPIYAELDVNQPLGILVLEIDPNTYLYPYLSAWPAPSDTAETLLVRREGDELVYLTPLRFDPDAALERSAPLTDADVLAVKAVLGESGAVEGIDYRGEPVIGAVGPVSNSDWFLVSRMDKAEVFAPLRARLWQTVAFFGALVLASGAGLFGVWRQQRLAEYRARVQALEELRVSEEKFRLAFDTSPDAVAITRLKDGLFVSVNRGFERILGYTAEEALGKTSLEINIWADPQDRRAIASAVQATGRAENFEARFRAKDGSTRDGLLSAAVIRLNGEPHILTITRDISERKRAEESLRQSEERYRGLFEHMVEGYAYCQMVFENDQAQDWIYLEVNDAFETLTGLKGVAGKRATEVIPGIREADPELFNRYARVSLTGRAEHFEIFVEAMQMWFSISVYSPEKEFFVAVFDVITERKVAEGALRLSEERYRSLAESSLDMIILLNAEGVIKYTNGFAALLLHTTPSELVGKDIAEIFPPDNAAHQKANLRKALERDKPLYVEEPLSFQGEVIWLSTWLTPIKSGGGDEILVVSRDITERKQAEEEIETLNFRLQVLITAIKELAAARTLETVMAAVRFYARRLTNSDGVAFILRDGDLCYYADEDAISPLWKGQRFPISQCIGGWVMLNKQPVVIEDIYADRRISLEMYRPTFVNSLAMVPIRVNDPLGALGCYWARHYQPTDVEVQLMQTLADAAARAVENVDLLQELEQRVRERTAELESANKELEAFAYSVSHDLRAPLRAIDGFTRILLDRHAASLDAEGARYFQLIRDNARQMGQLVDDLLALSRLGRQALKKETVSPRVIVQRALEELGAEQEGRQVEFIIGDLPDCRADPGLLKQVYFNLLTNALKFTRARAKATIEVGCMNESASPLHPSEKNRSRLAGVYYVRDNGVGFDMRYADKLFGVFQRLHRAEDYEGTGVGLAIVQRIVQRHGGTVWAEAEEGHGATFYFTI